MRVVFQWLLPLGFLGLLSLAGLILIYILKPKYQQRIVASSIPWALALKKRKRKFPFDRFSNIIVFLCQVLIFTAAAMILAQPMMVNEELLKAGVERIIILDAGMNMHATYAEYDGEYNLSRFEKAINEIKAEIDEVLYTEDGTISVILAESEPRFLVEDMGRDDYSEIVTALDEVQCSYSVPDLEGAVLAAQMKVSVNPQAKVEIYSGTDFGYMGDAVTVHNLSNTTHEWNIAILSAVPSYVDNQFIFEVEVGAFGNVSKITNLYIDIYGVDDGVEIKDFENMKIPVTFETDEDSILKGTTQTLQIQATDTQIGGNEEWFVPSFREAKLEFRDIDDSIKVDNCISVYGGERDEVKIQYYSNRRNLFSFLTFYTLQESMRRTRDIVFDPVYDIDEIPQNKGFDFYIYEHDVPLDTFDEGLPDDGVLIFFDPTKEILESLNIGVEVGEHIAVENAEIKAGENNPLMNGINAEGITISEYLRVTPVPGSGYTPLLYCGEDPVMFSKKQGAVQIVILPFSVNQTNMAFGSLALFYRNMIDYFMPLTLTELNYEIDSETTLMCKGVRIDVTNPEGEKVEELKEFPATYKLDRVGTYTFTTLFALNKPNEVRYVFSRPPISESCLFQVADLGLSIDNEDIFAKNSKDMFLIFAIVIVVLLFIEWFLQFKEII